MVIFSYKGLTRSWLALLQILLLSSAAALAQSPSAAAATAAAASINKANEHASGRASSIGSTSTYQSLVRLSRLSRIHSRMSRALQRVTEVGRMHPPTPFMRIARLHSLAVGDIISIPVKITSPIPWNAVQATVSIPSGLSLQQIAMGDCGLTFIVSPTLGDPSFAGAILGGQETSCTLYTLVLKVISDPSGTITISDTALIAASNSEYIPTSASCTTSACQIVGSKTGVNHFVVALPSTATCGSAVQGTVTAEDISGTVVPNYTGTVHFTSSDATAAVPTDHTFASQDGGTYTFSVTFGTTGPQRVTVTDTATQFIKGWVYPISVGSCPLRVPQDYPTIAQALQAVGQGGTVLVAPGIYHGRISVPAGVTLRGSGALSTVIDGDGTGTVVYLGSGGTLTGFTIQNSGSNFWDAGVWVGDASSTTTVTGNALTHDSMGVVFYCFNQPCAGTGSVANNLVAQNLQTGILINGHQATVVQNTVIDNHLEGITFEAAGSGGTLQGNILSQNNIGITATAATTVRDNVLWQNIKPYGFQTPVGSGDITADPLFANAASDDYHLHAASPAHLLQLNAPPDRGAFPFAAIGNAPSAVTPTQKNGGVTVSWPSTGAAGYYVYVAQGSPYYGPPTDVGNVTRYDLSCDDLAKGSIRIAISSYDQAHGESAVAQSDPIPPDVCDSPTISHKIVPPPNAAGWSRVDTTVSWNVSDPGSPIITKTGCDPITVTVETSGRTPTCTATNAVGHSSSDSVKVKLDKTPPTITRKQTTADGKPYVPGTWTNQSVTVDFTCIDPGTLSGVASCPRAQTFTTSGKHQVGGTAVDVAGNSTSLPLIDIDIDKLPPLLHPSIVPSPLLLHGTGIVTAGATDGPSGVATQYCVKPVTTTVGRKVLTCTAIDKAGNTKSAPLPYSVTYGQQLLYNTGEAYPHGQPITFSLQLTDARRAVVSASTILVTAVDVVDAQGKVVRTLHTVFKYSPSTGYVYVLNTTNLLGRFTLRFMAGGDPTLHLAPFSLR